MRKFLRIFILVSCVFGALINPSIAASQDDAKFVPNAKIEELFKKEGFNGTLVVYNLKQNQYDYYNLERVNQRFCPASTFKIFNTLIGLEAKVVKNVDEVFYKYDGTKVYLDTWAKDSNLRYAIKVSQVPAYKKLANLIGLEKMQEGINKLNYGNKNIGNKVDQFWLVGPLEISAREQVDLLIALAQSKLPFALENQKQVQDITILKQSDNFTLHGKTGWATDNIKIPIGWFVGWVENKDNIYAFALNVDLSDGKLLPKRESIVYDYFDTILD